MVISEYFLLPPLSAYLSNTSSTLLISNALTLQHSIINKLRPFPHLSLSTFFSSIFLILDAHVSMLYFLISRFLGPAFVTHAGNYQQKSPGQRIAPNICLSLHLPRPVCGRFIIISMRPFL